MPVESRTSSFISPNANESIAAYGIGTHRHAPEIQHLIQRTANQSPTITFTPHVVAMNRGILSTIYAQPAQGVTASEINQTLAEAYQTEPFMRVVAESPMTRQVTGTNFL